MEDEVMPAVLGSQDATKPRPIEGLVKPEILSHLQGFPASWKSH
jgi:hypothetical protein